MRRHVVTGLCLALLLVACGRPPIVAVDAAPPDAADARQDAPADPRVDIPVDPSRDVMDAARERVKGPPSNAKRIVPGHGIELVGSGQSSCSHESAPGATSSGRDRWCAFTRLFNVIELWVINITKAAAGVAIDCTSGSDPNCLRLSQNLWDERNTGPDVPRHPYVHRFTGDTLTFNADAVSLPGEHFRGPIFAWRPGWPAARQISSDDGWDCVGHFRAPVASCIDAIDNTVLPATFDLRAGPLLETSPLPLPRVERIISGSAAGVTKWRHRWDRDGRHLAWSASTGEDAEIFYWWRLADGPVDLHRRTGPSGISRWGISYDGRRTYLMKAHNDDLMGSPSGELWLADFPDAGAGQIKLADRVGGYALPHDGTDTDRGVSFLVDVAKWRGDFLYLADPTAPGSAVLVEPAVTSAVIHLGPETQAVFSKTDLPPSDLAIKRLDTGAVCQAASSPGYGGTWSMLQGGRLLIWLATSIGFGEGRYTTLPGCTGAAFSSSLDSWRVVGDQGWLYTDDSNGLVTTLRLAHAPDGATWPVVQVIQAGTGVVFGVIEPEFRTVVFTIDTGTYPDLDGLWMSNDVLPFSPVPAP